MTQKKLKPGVPRCVATSERTGERCKSAATEGTHLCSSHEPRVYVVSINFKPYERLPSGGFRRHLVAKPFAQADHAWNWLHDNWDKLTATARPGKHFVSASVECFLAPGRRLWVSRTLST